MPLFSYKANRPRKNPRNTPTQSNMITGTLIADTPRQARDELRAMGLVINQITLEQSGDEQKKTSLFDRRRTGITHAQVSQFVSDLSTLLMAGIPMLESLDSILSQCNQTRSDRRLKPILLDVRDQIAQGSSLAQALKAYPKIFDTLTINIVEVGESSGTLDNVLEQLSEFMQRSQQMRGRIINALIYPCIVLFVATLVCVLLMTMVVPQILEPMLEAGKELPWITVVVKYISDLLIAYWHAILATLLVAAITIIAILRTPSGRLKWHRLQLKLPIIGQMIVKQSIVRICVVMSTLLKSGIVFVNAIEIAQRSTKNQVIKNALSDCKTAVETGSDIAPALEKTGVFPATMIQLFTVGQKSGSLESMLDRLAADYDRQVVTLSQRFATVLEPVMIIILAIMVGVIAFATILPILDAGNVL